MRKTGPLAAEYISSPFLEGNLEVTSKILNEHAIWSHL